MILNRFFRAYRMRLAATAACFLTLASVANVLADSAAPLTPAEAKAQAAEAEAANDAVKSAAAALEKEYAAHLADNSKPIRSTSNFFTENANPAITPKAIIAGLNRSYGTPASNLYVRWQLLSGISGTVDASLDSLLLSIYRDAPAPPLRPGLDPDQKSQFKQAVLLLKEADAANINAQLDKSVEEWKTTVKPYTDYRDELATKLPVDYGLVLAEFRDGVQRASCGVDAEDAMGTAIKTGGTWADGDAKPFQLLDLAENVRSLLQEMGQTRIEADGDFMKPAGGTAPRAPGSVPFPGNTINGTNNAANNAKTSAKTPEPLFPPRYFSEVEWDAKSKSLQWKTDAAKFASKEDLIAFRNMLIEHAKASAAKANGAAASGAP